jgi:hypothetical protein
VRHNPDINLGTNVKPKNAQIGEGYQPYVRVEVPEVGRIHKLDPLVHRPCRVIENADNIFRLQIGPDNVRVYSDIISRVHQVREAQEHLDEGVRDARRGKQITPKWDSRPKRVPIRPQGRVHPSRESGKTRNRRWGANVFASTCLRRSRGLVERNMLWKVWSIWDKMSKVGGFTGYDGWTTIQRMIRGNPLKTYCSGMVEWHEPN